jgi:Zn-finger nucleic acid-binding protein
MHPVERREVTIDLCRDCKGVFLDRGELDKLLDAVEAREEGAHRPESDGSSAPTGIATTMTTTAIGTTVA